MFLSGIDLLQPPFTGEQDETARWLASAHAQSQCHVSPLSREQQEQFRQDLEQLLLNVSGWPDRIASRASFVRDFTHFDWSAMNVYNLDESPVGRAIGDRMAFFDETCNQAFQRLFPPNDAPPPADLIHVTCTGYVSPSAAQRLVVERGWQRDTTVTHLYHMGCYAAVPALRIGAGFLAVRPESRTDVVHTELCTLHFDPTRHDVEQLVVQSLFSDGVARYSLTLQPPDEPGFEIITVAEELLPETANEMTWTCHDHGMKMTLGREVPRHVERNIKSFVSRLFDQTPDLPAEKWMAASHYAVHPGGPLIIDVVAEQLGLKASQVRHSNAVLRNRGNMSSATLPHIWSEILHDPDLDPEQPVVSLAFGPGLTVCGAIMRQRRGA